MSTIAKAILFKGNAVKEGSKEMNYEGQFLIIKPEALDTNYREAKSQLVYATGGFGCKPENTYSTVYVLHCDDGETIPWRRSDFEGIATGEAINDWREEYGDIHANIMEKILEEINARLRRGVEKNAG